MIDLPIMGRDFFPFTPLCKDFEYRGLATIVCPHCGYHVTTFCKSINRANSIVCSNCGYVYKQAIISEDAQRDYTQGKVYCADIPTKERQKCQNV